MGMDKPVSALEASFLDIEAPGVPMHVAGVTIFNGAPPLTLADLRRLVASRVRRLPRFRQRYVTDPFGLTRGRWSRVRLDLAAHLFHHTLRAPGGRHELFALCARIHETPLRREQPLWEMHLIDGLADGDQALVVKTHHSITDGLAGVELAEVLFDPPAGTPRPHLPQTRFATVASPLGFGALQSLLGLAFLAAGGPLTLPGPFNGPVGPHRSFGAASLSMDAVRRAKRRLGGSIDDVIVASVAAGIYRYLVEVRYPQIPHALRTMLPVSTRRATRGVHLGNHVSSIFIDLPMRTDDPTEILPEISHSKATLRGAHAAAGGSLLVETGGMVPAPLHRPLMQLVSALPFAGLVLSDIPGPDTALQLLGHPVKACFPLMPLTGNIGLSIAALSMDGSIGIGVTADPGLVPDPQRLAGAIRRAFASLEQRPAQAHRPAAHRKAA
jgi:diacylglycerol O-acyltransferase / wax synthase